MKDLKKYIGIPYKFLGEASDGADCQGLIKMYYRDHGWPLVESDGKPIEPNWYQKDKYRFARYFLKYFDRTEDIDSLEDGDIIMFEINGEGHVAIYVEYGKILLTYPKVSEYNGGVSFIDRLKYWRNIPGVKLISCFKRRK